MPEGPEIRRAAQAGAPPYGAARCFVLGRTLFFGIACPPVFPLPAELRC